MNYSDQQHMCRVDFFKPNGKWYTTEAVSFSGLHGARSINDAFREALARHLDGSLRGMTAVCLEPFHEHSHPLMLVVE